MATNKTSTSSTLKTLKGLFELPKMKHRRDFLRENKLNLKELQRSTANKLLQIQHEQEKRQHMHLQHYQKQQEVQAAKRSRSKRLSAGEENQQEPFGQNVMRQRSQSQLRNERGSVLVKHDGYNNGDVNYCCCTHLPPAERHNRLGRSASSHSAASKAESSDKEIQTEDINDEQFLYEALKKCSTADIAQQLGEVNNKNPSNEYDNNYETTLPPNKYDNDQVSCQSEHFLHHNSNADYHKHNGDNKSQYSYQMSEAKFPNSHPVAQDTRSHHSLATNDLMAQSTARTQNSNFLQQSYQHKRNGEYRKEYKAPKGQGSHRDDYMENLETQMHDLDVEANENLTEPEMPASARSHHTVTSQLSKKKSSGSLHKVGTSRSDVRLPRYLEKEKREKEDERLRELAQDPNCPLDHYVLSEAERLKALNDTQKKVSVLIQELNRMPMTTETLRLRSRKVEIEKELSQLEANIRLFSKPKVYLPLSNESNEQYS